MSGPPDRRDGGIPHHALIAVRSIGELPPVANDEERRQLSISLRDSLYSGVYCRAGDARPSVNAADLSAANQSRSFWRDGWRIERVGPGWIVAAEGSRRRTARAHEYALTFAADLPPRAGMAVTLWFPRQSRTLQKDVYYAFGEAIPETVEETRALRFYLHVRDGALPLLFAAVTGELNRLAIPFELKTMLAPHESGRLDATVLYVAPRHAEAVLRALPRSHFDGGVPLFADEVAPGIGMAETPETGESFGMNRCRLVAEGVVDAWMSGRADVEARIAAVERRFRAAGIDWLHPHRNRERITLTKENAAAWLGADPSRFRVSDCSRRNRNFAVVRIDGEGGFFAKQLRTRGLESLRMMEREAEAVPLAGDLAPRLIRFDRDAEVLVFEWIESGEPPPLDLAAAAARTLRRLHSMSFPGEAEPPAILTAHRGGPLTQWLGPGQRELIDEIRASEVLASALDQMANGWRGRSFIHGDVKWDNCLWDRTESSVKWADWELAAAGDPLWDAGCFAQAYLSHFVVAQNEDLRPALDLFLAEYGGDTARILRYAAARMIQMALELMHGQPHPTPLARRLVARSEELLRQGS